MSLQVSQYKINVYQFMSKLQSIIFISIYPCLLSYIHFVVLVTIQLQTKVETHGISWEIIGTTCKSLPNLHITANRLYTKHCALSTEQSYELKCHSSGEGWGSNYLVVENTKYCENTQQMSTVNITITGKN